MKSTFILQIVCTEHKLCSVKQLSALRVKAHLQVWQGTGNQTCWRCWWSNWVIKGCESGQIALVSRCELLYSASKSLPELSTRGREDTVTSATNNPHHSLDLAIAGLLVKVHIAYSLGSDGFDHQGCINLIKVKTLILWHITVLCY